MDATNVQCFSSCLTPKIIVPSLLYAAEIWSYRENKQTETVHLYACKLTTSFPAETANDMIYGELGGYSLYIDAAAKYIQYWFRVLKQPAIVTNFTREGARKLGNLCQVFVVQM